MAKSAAPGSPITIKKYANRRLYNTETSSYITLDTLADMVRAGREFVVLDAKSGEDITHPVLTQIIMEGEGKGNAMLPTGFLRQIISMYGDSMQSMVPGYLEASMEAFRNNHERLKSSVEGALAATPLGEIAKRNIEMFEAAIGAFAPKPAAPKNDEVAASPKDDEVAVLKAELANLQAKVDRLGS